MPRSALGWVARTTRNNGSSIGARFGCLVPPRRARRARTRAGAIRVDWAAAGAAAGGGEGFAGRAGDFEAVDARGDSGGTTPGTAEVIAGSSPTLCPSAGRSPVYGEQASGAHRGLWTTWVDRRR